MLCFRFICDTSRGLRLGGCGCSWLVAELEFNQNGFLAFVTYWKFWFLAFCFWVFDAASQASDVMAEEEKGTSAWYRVPTWDGNPSNWRSFKREMGWWMASLDSESCRKFNVAARWTLRQTGVVRARCEEFEPHELEATPAITGTDPDSGDTVVLEEGDALAGLKKLLRCLEELNGKTALDRKGDLRSQFYQELKRQPNERINTFCTRFRSLVGEMRREGIEIPEGELGWFLRERLGLDPIRKQLLETALAGKDSYQDVESECLRLFRDLHSSDPLHRRFSNNRPPLLSRFLSQSQSGSSRTSLPSSASSMSSMPRSFRSSSTSTFKTTFRKPGNHPPPRQSMVTENEEEMGRDDEEELVPDAPAEESVGGGASLEEVLQLEAECLAAELQEAEEEGVEDDILDGLEMGVERAAESLLTMREARQKLNDVRKDCGYGGKSNGKGAGGAGGKGFNKGRPSGNQVTAKKNDPGHPCWDCGLPGHWMGDRACQKPGAGLAMPPGKKAKQVKIAEAQTAEVVTEEMMEHEVHMASCESFLCLDEALRQSHQPPNDVLNSQTPQLMVDKRLVGALDSACNRTCSGNVWLRGYLRELVNSPLAIRSLVATMDETETFRFGNGGTQQSKQRWRLPIMVGQTLVCIWVSVVEVPSLGLLLGRDFLDSIGGVLSFARKLLRADHLDGSLIRLRQLVAGHFALQLLPRRWPLPGPQGWKKLGVDGVLELQVSSGEWLNRRLQASGAFSTSSTHEHLITEHAVLAADVANSGLRLDSLPPGGTRAQDMLAVLQPTSNSTTFPSTRKVSSRTTTLPSRAHVSSRMEQGGSMGKNGHSSSNSRSMARARHVVMALAAISTALSALSLSSSEQCPAVAAASRVDGQEWSPFPKARLQGRKSRGFQHHQFGSLSLAQRSNGLETCIRGGPDDGRHVAGSKHQGINPSSQTASSSGSSKGGQEGRGIWRARQFLGPRGGLPSLRGDLIKLAALLHIPVEAKVTVEQLKAKIRPMVHSLKGEDSPQASGVAAASKSSPARPKTPKSVPSSPENSQVVLMRQMMEQQDVRFKHILDQALQQVMNAQQLGDPYQTQPMMDVSSQFTGATVRVPSLPTFPIHTPVEHQSTLDGNPNIYN